MSNPEICKNVAGNESVETGNVSKLENSDASGSSVNVKKDCVGMAAIKKEYIDLNHKPRFVAAYLPGNVAEEIKQIIDSSQPAEGEVAAPPLKKRKLKGRNKKRPVEKRMNDSDRLCPSVMGERTCPYGDRCKFSHDVQKFVESRQTVIDKNCYMFDKYGRCPFGVTCLFGDQHLTENFSNVVNQELVDKYKGRCSVLNTISKDLQIRLRKKEYNFKKSSQILKQIQETFKDRAVAPRCKDSLKNPEEADRKMKAGNQCTDAEFKETECEASVSSEITNHESIKEKSNVCSDGTNLDQSLQNFSWNDSCKVKEPPSTNDAPPSTNDATPPSTIDALPSTIDASPSIIDALPSTTVTPPSTEAAQHTGCVTDEDIIKLRPEEKSQINFKGKLYLAPLTTVGNLPFRRVCKRLGAEITCGEMAMPSNLLQGQASEWALLKRHESEKIFGIQLCGSFPDSMTRATQVITESTTIEFIDINVGCPIDLVVQKGEGCALMGRSGRFEQVVRSMKSITDVPVTVKMRTGLQEERNTAHLLLPKLKDWGVSMITIHGRSREQRYTKLADWQYIQKCAEIVKPVPIFGNGDILSYEDYNRCLNQSGVDGCMIARGALIKPWIFTEIGEQRHWDISGSERFEIVEEFVNYGLEHWGSDQQGVANTRRFLLEWLSFLHRYIPVGILERIPQRINEKPPHYFGRDDRETLLGSPNCADWIKLSEMFLGPVPTGFTFLPKHRANSYQ